MDLKEVLSLASSLSAVVVAVCAVVALRQVSYARKQIETTRVLFRTQAKRSSIEAAVGECRRFAETVIQDHLKILDFCRKEKLTILEDIKFKKEDDGIAVDPGAVKPEEAERLTEILPTINSFCNGLEAHAIFFLSGIADEDLAYHANAHAFVEVSETAYKLFALAGKQTDQIAPVHQLYHRWAQRIEADRLSAEEIQIRRKLANYKDKPIRPIGT